MFYPEKEHDATRSSWELLRPDHAVQVVLEKGIGEAVVGEHLAAEAPIVVGNAAVAAISLSLVFTAVNQNTVSPFSSLEDPHVLVQQAEGDGTSAVQEMTILSQWGLKAGGGAMMTSNTRQQKFF